MVTVFCVILRFDSMHFSANLSRSFDVVIGWYRGEKRAMKFGVPRIWTQPSNHINDCFFCMVQITRGKSSRSTVYPNILSSSAPVAHSADLPVPQRIKNSRAQEMEAEDDTIAVDDNENINDPCFEPERENHPHYPNQEALNDLIRDMALTKEQGEILSSRMKQWNLLHSSVRTSVQRFRHEKYSIYFNVRNDLCFANDIHGLFAAIGIEHHPQEWRLFIDSSKRSLKAVLLHNGNRFPTIPLAHSIRMKENYDEMKILLESLKYFEYNWEIIGDFKIITILLGMQGGFTKFPCHLCLWDSRDTHQHYIKKDWPLRQEFIINKHNVKKQPLVNPAKILMPPLHIKLGLIKQFVKALDRNSEAFKYLESLFPELSEAKVKGGIFVGPQIKKLMKTTDFSRLLNRNEKQAWASFVSVVTGFLGNERDENYEELVSNLVQNYAVMGCRMSMKLHMLDAHLYNFKDNMGAYSEEQGERFHQDLRSFEHRYQGKYNERMMGDYIWNIVRESKEVNRRKCRKSNHF